MTHRPLILGENSYSSCQMTSWQVIYYNLGTCQRRGLRKIARPEFAYFCIFGRAPSCQEGPGSRSL
jgi:hypothetical protein